MRRWNKEMRREARRPGWRGGEGEWMGRKGETEEKGRKGRKGRGGERGIIAWRCIHSGAGLGREQVGEGSRSEKGAGGQVGIRRIRMEPAGWEESRWD